MSGVIFRTGASFLLLLYQHIFQSTFPWIHPLPRPELRALLHLTATVPRKLPVAGACSHFPGFPLFLVPGATPRISSLLGAPVVTLRALGSFTASRFPAQLCIFRFWALSGAAVPSWLSPIPSADGQPQGFGVTGQDSGDRAGVEALLLQDTFSPLHSALVPGEHNKWAILGIPSFN